MQVKIISNQPAFSVVKKKRISKYKHISKQHLYVNTHRKKNTKIYHPPTYTIHTYTVALHIYTLPHHPYAIHFICQTSSYYILYV